MANKSMSISVGDRLGPYEILSQIGAGGMGVVYKARDIRLDRIVALKVAAEEYSERFAREARTVAALNHPNICQIHDVGPNFLVLEFLDGAPLLCPAEPGPLALEPALKYSDQICDALDAAHRKGMVHRDLKPANIVVTKAGVKLVDFGLAKVVRRPSVSESPAEAAETRTLEFTRENTVLGTPYYMSPEQAEGKSVDARSDIFSFGVVLYEMLSARKAFSGESAISIMTSILYKHPPPLVEAPPEVERVVLRCLAKRPEDRFQTIVEVKRALAHAAAVPVSKQPSIAVLPFVNLSTDKENEYFSDGLAEDILNALVNVPGLRVPARTSTLAFRGKELDIRAIAQALNVEHILEGSVRKLGSRLRVTAQLIKASDGYHVWSERYDREMTDVFAIQDEISHGIVETLKLKLGGRPLLTRQTADLEAYNLYLRGRHLSGRLNPESVRIGREYFQQALARDPHYARAYAEVGYLLIIEAVWGQRAPRIILPEAAQALEKALKLDANLPEAHAYLGCVRGFLAYDWAEAERRMRKALELGPTIAAVHFCYAMHFLQPLGRLKEAEAEFKRASQLDPLSHLAVIGLAENAYRRNEPDEAITLSKKALELDATYYFSYWMLGLASFLKGRIDEAVQAVERAAAFSERNPWVLASLRNLYSLAGRGMEAASVLAELEERAQRGYVAPGVFGIICLGQGQLETAMDWCEKAVEARDPIALYLATEPRLGRLRSHPRYQALRCKMLLPE
jgi:serine/threonine protein kinase/tetratricopeptide (TPR) repeat protein